MKTEKPATRFCAAAGCREPILGTGYGPFCGEHANDIGIARDFLDGAAFDVWRIGLDCDLPTDRLRALVAASYGCSTG